MSHWFVNLPTLSTPVPEKKKKRHSRDFSGIVISYKKNPRKDNPSILQLPHQIGIQEKK